MKALILLDADSAIFASCVTKKEDTEDGKGFIYNIEEAQSKFDEKVMGIINTLEEQYSFDVVHAIIFIEGAGNYRYSLNKTYKENRKDRELPPLINALRDWVSQTYDNEQFSVFKSINVETDDSIAATYRKFKDNEYGVELIVCSPDKDIKTIPCLLFDSYWSRMELNDITEMDATRNLFIQMIQGDAADGVKGIPKYGEKKAKALLEPISTTFGMIRATYTLYLKTFGRNAKIEFYKSYYSLRLNDANINTPDVDSILMFK